MSMKRCSYGDCKNNLLQTWRLCEGSDCLSVHCSSSHEKCCTHAIFFRSLVHADNLLDRWPPVLTYVKLTFMCKWVFWMLCYTHPLSLILSQCSGFFKKKVFCIDWQFSGTAWPSICVFAGNQVIWTSVDAPDQGIRRTGQAGGWDEQV